MFNIYHSNYSSNIVLKLLRVFVLLVYHDIMITDLHPLSVGFSASTLAAAKYV